MFTHQEGLTQTYNRFHDPDEMSADIVKLRELHKQMDKTVAHAYSWNDLELDHDFHDTKQGLRYTISKTARREVLDRLLLLNHQRHDEEVEAGLADTNGKPVKAKKALIKGSVSNNGKKVAMIHHANGGDNNLDQSTLF